eukprot:TRINITY_DN409_c1_g1_i1.p1 TRINITY_DN409_c1_g1~~TRINITY_DN409_c1_g1_i1.p1  ORF type:complete len:226 (-),score=60.22 TRINITY_DN409_c1_g1_i1:160-837(-)
METEQPARRGKFLIAVKIIVRIICGLVGLGLSAVGITVLSLAGKIRVSGVDDASIKLQTGITGFYCLIFGIMIVIAETRCRYTRHFFVFLGFLNTYIGRCIFYVFVGILVYPLAYPSPLAGTICGAFLVAGGGLNLILFPFFCQPGRWKSHMYPSSSSSSSSSVNPPPPPSRSSSSYELSLPASDYSRSQPLVVRRDSEVQLTSSKSNTNPFDTNPFASTNNAIV